MSSDKRVRSDRYSTEWRFANECWTALREGKPIPPIPSYHTYELDDAVGKEKLVKVTPITPMKITFKGTSYFGDDNHG